MPDTRPDLAKTLVMTADTLQVAVMILSLGFIAFVTVLHIVGKVRHDMQSKTRQGMYSKQ